MTVLKRQFTDAAASFIDVILPLGEFVSVRVSG